MTDKMYKCNICGTSENVKLCSSCESVAYCSPNHQREDWKRHKKSCSHVKVQLVNGEKCLVASRDIRPGEIILQEVPIFVYPLEACCARRTEQFCLTCGECQLNSGKSYKCSTCKFPMCSSQCEKNPVHAHNECKVFSSQNRVYPTEFRCDKGANCYAMEVFKIRMDQLKAKAPKDWEQIMDMVGDWKEAQNTDAFKSIKIHHCKVAKDPGELLEFQKFIYAAKLRGFLYINIKLDKSNFNVFQPKELLRSRNVYKKGSMIQHSCAPNSTWKIPIPSKDMKLEVRSATELKKGSVITVSKFHANNGDRHQSTFYRRRGLTQLFGFVCNCIACRDPTELGTFLSGYACTSSKCRSQGAKSEPGYFLPVNTTLANWDDLQVPWVCNRCGAEKVAETILKKVENINKGQELQVQFLVRNPEVLLKFIKEFIDSHAGKILHPHHWILLRLSRVFIIKASDLPWKEHSKYIQERIRLLLNSEGKFSKGVCGFRADKETFLGELILEEVEEAATSCSLTSKQAQELVRRLQDCKKFFDNAIAYFKYAVTPEEKIKLNHKVEREEERMNLEKILRQKILFPSIVIHRVPI